MESLVQSDHRGLRLTWIVGALLAAGAVSLPLMGQSAWMRELVEMSCFFLMAVMWNLLAGYGGMVSVGQQAYFGAGGYLMLVAADILGINPFLAIPLAGACTCLLALPLSKLAFRLRGGYFAIGTWVIAEVLRLSVANIPAVGGGAGTSLMAMRGISRTIREQSTYWIAVAAVFAALGLIYLFLRSKSGLALQAIRDNEQAAESQGIAVERMKLQVYLVAAFGTGLAGALYFVSVLRITPEAAFSVNWTAFAIFIVMIGGIGRIEGPLIGTLLFWVLNHFFRDYGTWYLIGLGSLAIAMILFAPRGLSGFLQQRLGINLMPTRRVLRLQEAVTTAEAPDMTAVEVAATPAFSQRTT